MVPPTVSTARVLDQLLKELPAALELHNSTEGEPTRFKVRLAVNVGPVVSHIDGVSGEAIIVAARLVEAPVFKRRPRREHRQPGRHRVAVCVRDGGQARSTAWMKLFAAPEPSPVPYSEASGSHADYLRRLRTGAADGRLRRRDGRRRRPHGASRPLSAVCGPPLLQ